MMTIGMICSAEVLHPMLASRSGECGSFFGLLTAAAFLVLRPKQIADRYLVGKHRLTAVVDDHIFVQRAAIVWFFTLFVAAMRRPR